MPQLCTVCHHANSREIDLAVVRGEKSNRDIARQFGVTNAALHRHRIEHLAENLQRSQSIAERVETIDLNRELAKCFQRANRLFDACHEWLTDPDEPNKYNLQPRSDDIWVIYTSDADDKKVKKKERLSTLLAKVEKGLRV